MDPISATFASMFAETAVGTGVAAGTATAASVGASALGAGTIADSLGTFAASGITDIMGGTAAESSIAAGLTGASDALTGLTGGMNFARMFNVGSTIFNTVGSLAQGIGANQQKQSEALQLDRDAQAKRAASSVQMGIEARDTDYAVSTARARGAAGGGGLDPSVMDIMGRMETQGATNEVNTEYNGESAARSEENQAMMDRFSGKQSMFAGDIGAVSSLFSGLGRSMSSKYGYEDSMYNPGYYGGA